MEITHNKLPSDHLGALQSSLLSLNYSFVFGWLKHFLQRCVLVQEFSQVQITILLKSRFLFGQFHMFHLKK